MEENVYFAVRNTFRCNNIFYLQRSLCPFEIILSLLIGENSFIKVSASHDWNRESLQLLAKTEIPPF